MRLSGPPNRALTHEHVETLAANFRAGDPNVEYAEPDRLMRPMFMPNDALYPQQWDLFDAAGSVGQGHGLGCSGCNH